MKTAIILLLLAICGLQYLENKHMYELTERNAYAQCYKDVKRLMINQIIQGE